VGGGVVKKFEDLFQLCFKSDNGTSLVYGSHGINGASRGKICCPAMGIAVHVTCSKPIEGSSAGYLYLLETGDCTVIAGTEC
jgi:hypothetical protein